MSRRKERRAPSLYRRRQTKQPYDVVLIVCEGAKTEPEYFRALINNLRLSTANIRICGKECGSAPKSVVDYAIEESNKTIDYDRVYCVFDKDKHETYDEAVRKLQKNENMFVITSVPCFEFWLLLHFSDAEKPYGSSGSKSPCEELISDLKKYISAYEKGGQDVFSKTCHEIEKAIERAERLEQRQRNAGTENPSTKVHELVKYLIDLSKSKER